MAHEEPRDTLRPLVWRLGSLVGITIAVVAILSSDRVRYGAPERFRVPVLGVDAADLVDSFTQPRDGLRRHSAIDIPAPRGTPVVAATGGRVHRIFSSPRGGIGAYQIDHTGARCLYYAHLDGYAEGLEEGQLLNPGDAIGFVGTTGNAPDDVPHLHFAVMQLTGEDRCSEAQPINPISLFR